VESATLDFKTIEQKTCGVVERKEPKKAEAKKEKAAYRFVKRIFDITVSVIGLAVLGVPMLLVALIIRLDSPGPALFKQKRLGKDGVPFVIYKFRTMRIDAPDNVATNDLQDAFRYVTRFGNFLRRTSIDELPQLINVIRGEMSIVGFRPVCLSEKKLNDYRMERGVFSVRPGMTGLAQVSGRDGIGTEKKVDFDVEYVEKQSVRLDLWCIYKTIGTVVSQKGVK